LCLSEAACWGCLPVLLACTTWSEWAYTCMYSTPNEAEDLTWPPFSIAHWYTKCQQPHIWDTHQGKSPARIIVTIKVKTVRVGVPHKPGRLSPRSASLPGNRKLREQSQSEQREKKRGIGEPKQRLPMTLIGKVDEELHTLIKSSLRGR
jgi:hypothetical protein